jgi:hypothetical protein
VHVFVGAGIPGRVAAACCQQVACGWSTACCALSGPLTQVRAGTCNRPAYAVNSLEPSACRSALPWTCIALRVGLRPQAAARHVNVLPAEFATAFCLIVWQPPCCCSCLQALSKLSAVLKGAAGELPVEQAVYGAWGLAVLQQVRGSCPLLPGSAATQRPLAAAPLLFLWLHFATCHGQDIRPCL